MKLPKELQLLQPKALLDFRVTPKELIDNPHVRYSLNSSVSVDLTLTLEAALVQSNMAKGEGECRTSLFIKWVQQLF